MINVYHVLHKYPALEWYEMYKETEELAQKLATSGLLRIDALEKSNFVRFAIPSRDINIALSDRQLRDPNLIPQSKEIIRQCLLYANYKNIDEQLEIEWRKLHKLLKQNIPIYPEWEIKIARLLVQSSHPIVTHLILLEDVEMFVSFGFEIGDIMDIQTWQSSGKNSGMQSTDGINTAIYVSCGGNPFVTSKEYATYSSDGFQAIARTLVIAGQEMGHYSDILRNHRGQKVSRHSADFGGRRAKRNVLLGRRNDLLICDQLFKKMCAIGLMRLDRYNNDYRYYKKHNFYGFRRTLAKRKMILMTIYFRIACRIVGLEFVKHLRKEEALGSQITIMYSDMKFNLCPKADVYSREDLEEEEAIACIEALARVPQQVNKWGHHAVEAFMHNLYHIYYEQVIPTCIDSYEHMSGKKYNPKLTKQKTPLIIHLKRLFKKIPKKEFAPLYLD